MSSAPRLKPLNDLSRKCVSSESQRYSGASETAPAPASSVLLVGRSGTWGASVLKSLEKLGCELSMLSPDAATPEYFRGTEPEVVLLDSAVSVDQRRVLTAELIGSRATVFYAFPVENGCWWLPALARGEDCHGAPAFRGSEFSRELERLTRRQSRA